MGQREILVLAEHRRGDLREVTLEMLSLARRLAGQSSTVTTLLLGQDTAAIAERLIGAAQRVVQVEHPDLAHCDALPYLAVLEAVLRQRQPVLTLIGHTAAGMDLAPALAARLALPLFTDCLDVQLGPEGVVGLTRQVYGGKLQSHLTPRPRASSLVSVRPGSFPADGAAMPTEIERVPAPDLGPRRRRRWLRYLEAEIADIDIAAAPLLVSVGRGVGKQENMAAVEAFAHAIGATLACSRPVADKGWLPKSRQVGTSGKTVRPRVYIALGISGSYQHLAGMHNADTIIAVNRDPAAPIFDVAHYGVVADMFEVLPRLRERFASK